MFLRIVSAHYGIVAWVLFLCYNCKQFLLFLM